MLPIHKQTARVRTGGTVTVVVPEGYEGWTVSVSVTPQNAPDSGSGILDYLESLPKQTARQHDWAERDREFRAERDAWDR